MINIKGFTLIELLITLVLVSILASIGIPSFTQMITNNRLATQANELITSINMARSEAIKRGVQITIRRKGANSQQWESGWDIFIDADANETFNDNGNSTPCESETTGFPAEDCLLRTYPALEPGYTLRTGSSTIKDYVAFNPEGITVGNAGDTFRLCDSSNDTSIARAIVLNTLGRARVSIGTGSCP